MLRKLLLSVTMMLLSAGVASALSPQVGDYQLDWAILHNPVSSDQPTLEAETWDIKLENAAGTGFCPPTSAFVVRVAPAASIMGGSTTWCFKSDGAVDTSANFQTGSWLQYNQNHAIIQIEQGSRGNDKVMAVAVLQTPPPPPPPPSPLKVFITSPKDGSTVSGTVWVVIWAEGTTGTSNTFTLKVDGQEVGRQNAGSSRGPVTIPWNTKGGANGTHALQATVVDASGATGSTSMSVIVNNP
jgi:hypothetical protein